MKVYEAINHLSQFPGMMEMEDVPNPFAPVAKDAELTTAPQQEGQTAPPTAPQQEGQTAPPTAQ